MSYFQLISKEGPDAYIRGLLLHPSQQKGQGITEQLSGRQKPLDTVTETVQVIVLIITFSEIRLYFFSNLQRGRDHGIPSYNEFRQSCGMPVAAGFDDLSDTMSPRIVDIVRRIYR